MNWVFPMHMGMVLKALWSQSPRSGIPHAHGDGSAADIVKEVSRRYSPCTWGWFSADSPVTYTYEVFPTYVGMILFGVMWERCSMSIPHACGDGSINRILLFHSSRYSPRMWGWFLIYTHDTPTSLTYSPCIRGWFSVDSPVIPQSAVFPVHTGMVPYFISSPSFVKKSFVHATFTVSGSFLNMKRSFSSLP